MKDRIEDMTPSEMVHEIKKSNILAILYPDVWMERWENSEDNIERPPVIQRNNSLSKYSQYITSYKKDS